MKGLAAMLVLPICHKTLHHEDSTSRKTPTLSKHRRSLTSHEATIGGIAVGAHLSLFKEFTVRALNAILCVITVVGLALPSSAETTEILALKAFDVPGNAVADAAKKIVQEELQKRMKDGVFFG